MRDTTLQHAGASVERRGFLDNDDALKNQFMRITEGLGELMQAYRKGGDVASELADVVIVAAAIARLLNIDLDAAILEKCAADEKRGYMHGNANEYGGALVSVPVPVQPPELPETYYNGDGRALYHGLG